MHINEEVDINNTINNTDFVYDDPDVSLLIHSLHIFCQYDHQSTESEHFLAHSFRFFINQDDTIAAFENPNVITPVMRNIIYKSLEFMQEYIILTGNGNNDRYNLTQVASLMNRFNY